MMGVIDLFRKKVSKESTTVRPTDHYLPTNFIPIQGLFKNKNTDKVLIELYNNVAEVNSIITYLAQVFATLPSEHVTVTPSSGKEKPVKNSLIIPVLQNPNQVQNGTALLMNTLAYYYVTGNAYLYWLIPTGFNEPTKLYLLQSENVYPIPVGAIDEYGAMPRGYDYRNVELQKYHYILDDKVYTIPVENVLHIKDSSISSVLKGTSRLMAGVNNIKSLRYVCETINTLLANQGALGFIKRNSKAGEMSPSITGIDDDIKIAEAKYLNDYGNIDGKKSKMFTSLDLSYIKTSEPIADFQPIELSNHEFKILCMLMGGFPDVLLKATDTTYSNMEFARKLLYENVIAPFADNFYSAVTEFAKAKMWIGENEVIKADYENIAALQEDIKTKVEGEKVNDELWINRYDNNLCTLNEMLTAIGLPIQTDGDKYKRDDTETIHASAGPKGEEGAEGEE